MINIIARFDSGGDTMSFKDLFTVIDVKKVQEGDNAIVVKEVRMTPLKGSPVLTALCKSIIREKKINCTVVGKSKRIGSDEFDRFTGIDIADHKANIKAYNIMLRILNECKKSFNFASAQCSNMSTYVTRRRNKQLDYAELKMNK